MEQYWDCSLCRVENKGKARRCRSCAGKLKGRDRLLWEIARRRRTRSRAGWLSAVAAGLGQVYQRRFATGLAFGVLLPLALGLVLAVWSGFSYGHIFLVLAAVFVLGVAVVDARLGPRPQWAPCQKTCPANVAIPDYLQLILDDDLEQGYALIRTRIPLVGVVGRVCPHPCEAVCLRGIDGEPIAINGAKRFLADRKRAQGPEDTSGEREVVVLDGDHGRVAVVGSGPASLACAYYLRLLGCGVAVFEAGAAVGGRLATTLPSYRLPGDVLGEEVEDLRSLGIQFRTGTPVGRGGVAGADLLAEHDAVFLGVGAQVSLALDIPGAEQFLDFQQFLAAARDGTGTVPERVAVVGGGNAAIDAARVALRCGARSVHLVYRRSRDEMPARDDEVEEALREGVQMHYLSDPVAAELEDGTVRALTLRKMRLAEPDASGRRRPVAVADSDWRLEVDAVIPALGQRVGDALFADPTFAGLERAQDGRIRVDPETQRTNRERIYAGGDVVTGPSTVVEALAQGRRAALALFGDLFPQRIPRLRLRDRRIRKPFPGHTEVPQARIREEMPALSLHAREGFREVEQGFEPAPACREAGRCLQCHREL